MANTITNLIPDAYAALDVVSRELVGFIPGVTRDARADRVAVGQTLRIPYTAANTAGGNITPAMALPSAADQTIANRTLTISKSRFFPFSWSGEQAYAINQGPGYLSINQQQIAQAIRAAINEVETDIAAAAAAVASNAYGTAGTTPFGTSGDLSDLTNVRKLLADNGAPVDSGMAQLVINTTAGAKFRNQANLFKVNEAGSTDLLRRGVLLETMGFKIRESAQIPTPTAGTGTSYQLNGSHAAGATTITVDTGSGTILAGDVVTINSVKYVVATALSSGSFTIQSPGLKSALADNTAVTVNAAAARNIAYTSNAILLATRLPDLNTEGDMAIMRETITDPVSGLSMELAAYPGYRMMTYHISLNWGVTVIKPEHCVQLLG